jgi:ribonuclease P protein subunit POP4
LKQLEKIQASIEEEKLSLETVLKINKLWMQYCAQLMGRDKDQPAICGKILKADWTGAFLEVSNSTNKFLIGVKGYVVKETQRSFELMNDKGEIKRVLKQGTVIEISVVLLDEQRKVRIWLDNLMQRSHMRTKQKFKEKEGKLDLF